MASLGRRSVGKWLVVVLAAAGAVTGYVLSGLSPEYQSQATLQVIPPRVSGDIVRTPATGRLEDRLAALKSRILTRTRLEGLIRDLNLYESERRAGAIMQDVVELMARNIGVTVESPRAGEAGALLVVSYTAREPRTAQRVAERLASLFRDESVKDGVRSVEATSEFLDQQIAEAGVRLTAHDERMTAARTAGSRDSGRMQIEAEVLRNNYRALLEKREQALTQVRLAETQNGEQLVLIETPRLPERPVGPARSRASLLGGLAGLALGVAVSTFVMVRRALASRTTEQAAV